MLIDYCKSRDFLNRKGYIEVVQLIFTNQINKMNMKIQQYLSIIDHPSNSTRISFKKMIDLPKHGSIPLKHNYKLSAHEITTSKRKRGEAKQGKFPSKAELLKKKT